MPTLSPQAGSRRPTGRSRSALVAAIGARSAVYGAGIVLAPAFNKLTLGGPMIARDVMTPNPLTVPPQASIAEAWEVMRELAVRHVPVVEDGALVGMLSDRDLAQVDIARVLKAQGAEALREELETPIIGV